LKTKSLLKNQFFWKYLSTKITPTSFKKTTDVRECFRISCQIE